MGDAMKTEAVRIEPALDGNVRVTVTEQAGPAVSVTVSAVVDWVTFCRQAWPIVEGYMSRQRDGITDVLPPAPEKNDE